MQVDDFSQYTDEEIRELQRMVKIKEHVFGPGPLNRRERRQAGFMNSGKRKGRCLGGAKVKR